MAQNRTENRSLTPTNLAVMIKDRRARSALSLRDAAAEANVSFNTLARIEKGHIPDLLTFQRLADWLGVSSQELLGPSALRAESTPDVIAEHLKRDPALSESAAEKIASIVQDLYSSLARRGDSEMHLRASRTFRPEAAHVLSQILVDLRVALDQKWR